MQTRRSHRAVLALVGLLVSSAAWAQGRVTLRVVDEGGEPVENVSVHVRNDQLGYESQGATDANGNYTMMFVDASQTYTFRLQRHGFQPVVRPITPTAGGWHREEITLTSATNTASPVAAVQDASDAVTAFNHGVEAYEAGDLEVAEDRFLEAIGRDRKMVVAYSALGTLYLSKEEPKRAIAMANRLLELNPESIVPHEMLYDAYHSLGEEDSAERHLEQIQGLEGGADAAALRLFNLGVKSAQGGDLAKAAEKLTRALDANPTLAVGHSALAGVLYLQGQYKEALRSAENAISLDPGLVPAWRNKYESQIKLGDEMGATQTFAQLKHLDPEGTAETFYNAGVDLYNQGETARARTAFEQALLANPNHGAAHYQLALVLVQVGDTLAARQHLNTFLELAPNHADADTAREMLEYLK